MLPWSKVGSQRPSPVRRAATGGGSLPQAVRAWTGRSTFTWEGSSSPSRVRTDAGIRGSEESICMGERSTGRDRRLVLTVGRGRGGQGLGIEPMSDCIKENRSPVSQCLRSGLQIMERGKIRIILWREIGIGDIKANSVFDIYTRHRSRQRYKLTCTKMHTYTDLYSDLLRAATPQQQ